MSYCIINKDNFEHNINLVLNHITIDKLAIVLKNNAYGHGLDEMSKLANANKIKHAIVINFKEAKKIVDLFDSVLVLSGIPGKKPASNISVAINQLSDISKIPKGTNVELKVDTGMHRNGVPIEQVDLAIKNIKKANLDLKGVFTHFANIFSGKDSIYIQKKKFDALRNRIVSQGFKNIRFHCSSSPGLFCIDNNEYDLVRVGIALYGYVDLPKINKIPNLKPILSLWAEKISTRLIQKGFKIGYAGAFKANKKMTISTYDIGYGDGFLRLDEDKIYKIKDGRDILGRVSMNNLALEGNDQKVCIFDDVRELAKVHKTISYEILCRINNNIKREVV